MRKRKVIPILDEEDLGILKHEVANDFYIKFSSLVAECLDRAVEQVDFYSVDWKTKDSLIDELLEQFQEKASVHGSSYDSLHISKRFVTLPHDVYVAVQNALESARYCDHDDVQPALNQFEQFDLFYY